jgi:HPt (histidine-containing phosphotransfer) domain-containing protein
MTQELVTDGVAIERLQRLGGAELVRGMLELFLAQAPERIRALEAAAAAGDASQVEKAAHSLKSSAGNLGALRLQNAAALLELAAGGGFIDTAVVHRVRTAHEATAEVLQRVLEEMGS